ncbi:FAD-dependent oxidoreductase [Kaistia dalseonensis]|uniref:Sarcosine oxidase subunit beta n=1 Tax=Kaistia dalseonensis TaxID=410840 RepID=A0ABU0HAI7_9HYPH|nr:FAD-dependent oxidoreductase [Kaistia dalseonensis]MCX5496698.1 FAD-dependent oxidoreductase [Kaistia dalseonensis]MDQ0439324.1 sarcosine oxidase subunit beta [Kaistia dalseonensis]
MVAGADVIVVGAGVVGAAVAEALSRTGRSVHVVEQGLPGGAVSGASLACIGTHMNDEEELPFLKWCCDEWAAFDAHTPTFEYDRCGQLRFLKQESELNSARHWIDVERNAGLAPELLDPAEVRRIEPLLTGPIHSATWSPNSAVVNPFLAVRMLLETAQAQGVRLTSRAPATKLRLKGDRVIGVETSAGPIDGDHVVIAGGPWTAKLAATAGVDLPIVPRKAQCLATVSQPRSIRTVVGACKAEGGVDAGYTQIQQAMSGQILFNTVLEGGVTAHGSPDAVPEVDRAFIRDSVETLLFLFPSFAEIELLRSWVRYEAVTPDDRFLTGPVGPDGLYIAAGDGGVGFCRSVGMGRIIADQIEGRPSPFRTDLYDPARFERRQAA